LTNLSVIILLEQRHENEILHARANFKQG